MKFKTTLKTAALCFGMALTVASCSGERDSNEIAEDVNDENLNKDEEKAADKLVHAYSANMFEIKAAENASVNGVSDDVKKLSAMLLEAHSKMNSDVKFLADAKGIMLPSELTEEQKKELEKLTEKTGMDYDKAFTEKMKHKHEDALKFYEKTAEKCEDSQIKSWASEMVPEVRSHLDMVLITEDAIKAKK